MTKRKRNHFAESTRAILNVWKNKLNLDIDIDYGSIKWVSKFHGQINKLIKQYDNLGTRKNHYSILQKILNEVGPKKLYDKYHKIFENLRTEIDRQQSDNEPGFDNYLS